MAKIIKVSEFTDSIMESVKRWTLNFTDITGNSNKYYNLEIVKDTKNQFYLHTRYGRVGTPSPAADYRLCDSLLHAEDQAIAIIKSKTKKGYNEIKLVQSNVGSDIGKTKVEEQKVTVEALERVGIKVERSSEVSSLHVQVRDLVSQWFGATAQFINANLNTNECPLGQLSVDQLVKGRDILDECRKLLASKRPDLNEQNRLTSQYYGNIPHNFGHRKLDADVLRFDSNDKIDKGLDILDVFADAKNAEKVLAPKSGVDSQYETLKADIEYVDPSDPTYRWLEQMLIKTRASNHAGLGKIKLHRAFKMNRHTENKHFMNTIERISKECGKQTVPDALKGHVQDRPDVDGDLRKAFKEANVLPVWHGTRRANMIGITTKGLLIRPSGVPHAGSMFGDGIYWAAHSTKSINYTDVRGSYWAGGGADKAFLFLADCAFGNQRIVHNAHFFKKSDLRTDHSVWAKSGPSLLNDELIVYNGSGSGQQHRMKYILEFSTKN